MFRRPLHIPSILIYGVLSALLPFVALITQSILLVVCSVFAQLPLAYLGLSRGRQNLAFGCGLSVLIVTLVAGLGAGGVYLVFVVVPLFMAISRFLIGWTSADGTFSWYPVEKLVSALLFYGFFAVLMTFWFFDIPHVLESHLDESIRAMNTQNIPLDVRGNVEVLFGHIKALLPYFPGMMIAGSLTISACNFALGQKIALKQQQVLRPTPQWENIELPWKFWWLLAVLGLAGFFATGTVGYVAMNMIIVLGVGFLLQGLAVVHFIAKRKVQGNMFFWVFYTLMILFSWLALMVILIGIFEPWLRLRDRFRTTQE